MAINFSAGTSNAIIAATSARVDGGSIEIRTGAAPATADDAVTGTLLVTLTLPSPSFGTPSAKSAAMGTVATATAVATGTAGYARFKNSTGAAQFDGTVGTTGANVNLASLSITSGGTVSATSGTMTGP